MLILILILVFLYYLLKFNSLEKFINFRLPNEGHWCEKNNCDYPVITIIEPNKDNKELVKMLNPNGNLLPKNKSMNASCVNCILQNNNNCMYFTIDSKESILNISDLFKSKFPKLSNKLILLRDSSVFSQ